MPNIEYAFGPGVTLEVDDTITLQDQGTLAGSNLRLTNTTDDDVLNDFMQLVHTGSSSGVMILKSGAERPNYWFLFRAVDKILFSMIGNKLNVLHGLNDTLMREIERFAAREKLQIHIVRGFKVPQTVPIDRMEWRNLGEIDDTYLFRGIKLAQRSDVRLEFNPFGGLEYIPF